MFRKPVLLGRGEWVMAEPLLVLEVQDEGPDLNRAYGPHVGGPALGAEEALEVGYTDGHGPYGLLALALGPGAERVAAREG